MTTRLEGIRVAALLGSRKNRQLALWWMRLYWLSSAAPVTVRAVSRFPLFGDDGVLPGSYRSADLFSTIFTFRLGCAQGTATRIPIAGRADRAPRSTSTVTAQSAGIDETINTTALTIGSPSLRVRRRSNLDPISSFTSSTRGGATTDFQRTGPKLKSIRVSRNGIWLP